MATLGEHLRAPSGEMCQKKALVVQGGGMRGVYSMGALAALEDAGLREAFDVIVGASAGAINAAYFLAGQAHAAVDVYVETLSNKHFVNLARIFKIVDIDYLVDHALKEVTPLDVGAVRRSPTLLEIVLTDSATAEPVVFSARDESLDLFEVIRATAALPALYNKRVHVNGREYIDGGTVDAVPIVRALETGADCVLSVLTRSPGFRRTDKWFAFRVLSRALARGQSRAVKQVMGRADPRFNTAMDLIEGLQRADHDFEQWSVWPSDPTRLVSRVTYDRARLRDCADMGQADMERVLTKTADVEVGKDRHASA